MARVVAGASPVYHNIEIWSSVKTLAFGARNEG